MKKATFFGWTAGIILMVLLSSLLPEVRCADGWYSLSIGKRGACSHHGGVDGNGFYVLILFIISFFFGMFVFNKLNDKYTNSGNQYFGSNRIFDFFNYLNTGWYYLIFGIIFCLSILANNKAIPVFVIGLIYIFVGIRKLINK